MKDIKVLNEYAVELERRLHVKTYPLAIKLLRNKEEIPEGAVRPSKDMGYPILLCQAFATSRRDGATNALLLEDMYCFEPVLGFGMAEAPQEFLDGHNRFPVDVESLEVGKRFAVDFPCLPVGEYIGVLSAPLKTATFVPDVVLIYCNSAQLHLLLLAREYKIGYDLKQSICSHAACVYSVVPAIKSGEYQVAVPCRGDRYYAIANDEELIFGVPTDRMEDLITGVRYLETTGSKLPRNYAMKNDPMMPPNYMEIGRKMGMNV